MHAFLDIAFKLLNQRNPKLVDGQGFLVYSLTVQAIEVTSEVSIDHSIGTTV